MDHPSDTLTDFDDRRIGSKSIFGSNKKFSEKIRFLATTGACKGFFSVQFISAKLHLVTTNFVLYCLYRNTNGNLSSCVPSSGEKVQLGYWQFSLGKLGGNNPSTIFSAPEISQILLMSS